MWHKKDAMARTRSHRPPAPLDRAQLEELALRYVGKYATTSAKLTAYLSRKVRERGWNGLEEPDCGALAKRLCELGYIDDAAYALAKSRLFTSRGYGRRRLEQDLRFSGIGEHDRAAALERADQAALEAALRFAERRRIGPYSSVKPDRREREKAIGSMVRAGHPFGLARAIASLEPGAEINREQLSEQSRLTP